MKNLIALALIVICSNIYADDNNYVDTDGYTCSIYKMAYSATGYYSCHTCINYSTLIRTENNENFGGDTTVIAWTKMGCPSPKNPNAKYSILTSKTIYDCSTNTFASLFIGTSDNINKKIKPVLEIPLAKIEMSQSLQPISPDTSDNIPAYFKNLACTYSQTKN